MFSNSGSAASCVSKYRPAVPLVVVSSQPVTVSQACLVFGQQGLLVQESDMQDLSQVDTMIARAMQWAQARGMFTPGHRVVVLHGTNTLDTDNTALLKIIE